MTPPRRYETILFDLDHTLLDSDASERAAYAHTMAAAGLDDPDAHFDRYVAINRAMWQQVEAGSLRPDEVRTRRFERFVDEVGLAADPDEMADAFVVGLGANGELYDGVRDVLDALLGNVRMALVTNGLSAVQRSRIERLDLGHYFGAVTISSEVGVTKPRREIFDLAFAELGDPPRSSALMVGDSLGADMRGGAAAGIATCWYNPCSAPAGPDDVVTHEVRHLAELLTL